MIRHNVKIRTQVFILALIALLLALIAQGYYYLHFNSYTKGKSKEYFTQYALYIKGQAESQIDTIRILSRQVVSNPLLERYLTSEDAWIKYNMGPLVNDFLRGIQASSKLINGIYLLSNTDNTIALSFKSNSFDSLNFLSQFRTMSDMKPFYKRVASNQADGKILYAYVEPVYSSLSMTEYSNKIAFLGTVFDLASLGELLPTNSDHGNYTFLITDEQGVLITGNAPAEAGKMLRGKYVDTSLPEKYVGEATFGGKAYMYSKVSIEPLMWNLYILSPLLDYAKDVRSAIQGSILIGLVTVAIFIFFLLMIVQSINRPLRHIINEMQGISGKDIKKRLSNVYRNEIGLMSEHINQLLDELEIRSRKIFGTQKQLFEMELSRNQAVLTFLQNQINPHFLYNTLECIRSIADYYQIEEVVLISRSMAKIFKYCTSIQSSVALREEVECIYDYFQIIHIRFSGKYILETDIDPAVYDVKIIKMIIQPIVENAVFHGLESKRGKGTVRLEVQWGESGSILVTISDTGTGMTREVLEQLQIKLEDESIEGETSEKTGIGLVNIHRRIRLNYGEAYGMKVESECGIGTRISIHLPGKLQTE